MEGFSNNGECVLAYVALFEALSSPEADAAKCAAQWEELQRRESVGAVPLAPPLLRVRFALSERDFLLSMAALALELDGGLRGAVRRRYGLTLPTVEYGLQLIEPICPANVEDVAELAGPNPLTGLLLVPFREEGYGVERPLILCREALAFLTGFSLAEVPGLAVRIAPEDALPLHRDALEELRGWYASGGAPLYLAGPEGSGRRTLLSRAAGSAVCVDLDLSSDRERTLREAVTAARLLEAPICAVPAAAHELEALCRTWSIPLAILTDGPGTPGRVRETVRLPRSLMPEERALAWRFFLPDAPPDTCPEGAMGVGAMEEIASASLRCARAARRDTVRREDVRRALRRRAGPLAFAVRCDADVSLENMVLPETVREQLQRICQAAESGTALLDWGLPRVRGGVTAVFHGPSGTGKTMAAGAVAARLGLPLLRVDLSQVMDKYVGETEKHLARLLQSARENRCVLLFDEADALFSKRAEVTGGHDKYANLSTSYLLQEIEGYEGVGLLSTNLLSNFDEAFLRRLRYIVRFSLPDAAAREALWRRALPPERIAGEVPWALLAQAELSPARIHNAVRTAAEEAAASGRDRVDAAGLAGALKLELEKSGKPLPREIQNLQPDGIL